MTSAGHFVVVVVGAAAAAGAAVAVGVGAAAAAVERLVVCASAVRDLVERLQFVLQSGDLMANRGATTGEQ